MSKLKKAQVDSLPEGQKEYIELTRLMWRHVLDPIWTFSELVRGYGRTNGQDVSLEELSATLRLLVLGGYTETKVYCSSGGHLTYLSGDLLEDEIKYWDTARPEEGESNE